ncbi:YPO3983 family protein [Enterobacter bugandensis]|uniref:YPO3983 family protein n=1 Tax=Enterobacter bugandensis TaxID=881260 RepID=UPI0006692764|nr:YPO3983 family protein [Enterobacter bugandensis]
MVNSLNSSMFLPFTLFETVARFDDYSADDMQCGDMGEDELLALGLRDISAHVDPYRLVRYDFPEMHHLEGIVSDTVAGSKITHEECVDILFTEMKELSLMFSFYGEYKALIGEMIDHFRYGNGRVFFSQKLNSAFHKKINNNFPGNPLYIIEEQIHSKFYSNPKATYFPALLNDIKCRIFISHLPKFDSKKDNVNGLGISIHDIAAQKIILNGLHRYAMGWSASVHFIAQDHFGLDVKDIKNELYNKFRFFRIWFFLQRHKAFAYKPYFTNFHSIERIEKY